MGADRPRRVRRARSLTARIAGATVIVLATFLGVVSATIDALERGGTVALILLFAGIVSIAVLVAFAVARAHARTLADLIAVGAPDEAYPRDARAIARAVRDARPAPVVREQAPPAAVEPEPSAATMEPRPSAATVPNDVVPPEDDVTSDAPPAQDRLSELLAELRRRGPTDTPR